MESYDVAYLVFVLFFFLAIISLFTLHGIRERERERYKQCFKACHPNDDSKIPIEDSQKSIEHLTIRAETPADLPKIEIGGNVIEKNAFSVIHDNISHPTIIYAKSTRKDTVKMLMFTNRNVWVNTREQEIYHVVAYDQESARLASILMSLAFPSSSPFWRIDSVGKEEFFRKGVIGWKSKKRILFCLFVNEDDEKSAELADVMSIWSLQVFDYLSMIEKKKIVEVLPYARLEGFQMRLLFPEKKELDYIYEVLSFDTLVYIEEHGDIMRAREHIRNKVIQNLQKYYSSISEEPENDNSALLFYEKIIHEKTGEQRKRKTQEKEQESIIAASS